RFGVNGVRVLDRQRRRLRVCAGSAPRSELTADLAVHEARRVEGLGIALADQARILDVLRDDFVREVLGDDPQRPAVSKVAEAEIATQTDERGLSRSRIECAVGVVVVFVFDVQPTDQVDSLKREQRQLSDTGYSTEWVSHA